MRKILLVMIVTTLSLTGVSRAVNAPLTDDSQTIALWHMDEVTSQGTTPRNYILDDDSVVANRNNDLLLGAKAAEGTTAPTVVAGMSGFGNALSFDGINDTAIFTKQGGAWQGASSLLVDMWVKPMSNAAEQTIMYVGGTQAVMECRWETNGQFKTWMYDSANGYKNPAVSGVLNVWNHVVITASDAGYSVAVTPLSTGITASSTGTFATGHFMSLLYSANTAGDIALANKGGVRYLTGQMDEVKIATIPEPASMCLLGLGGLLALRNRKK